MTVYSFEKTIFIKKPFRYRAKKKRFTPIYIGVKRFLQKKQSLAGFYKRINNFAS
jgi:hypothetical protein